MSAVSAAETAHLFQNYQIMVVKEPAVMNNCQEYQNTILTDLADSN
jgi:hypothetical protein